MSSTPQLLAYDPDTGDFLRKKSRGWQSICLAPSNQGYYRITFDGKAYDAHILAFLFMGVEIPKGMQVDHCDRDKANNRWDNLRLVTKDQNARNNKCVGIQERGKKFWARIQHNHKRISKSFGTYEDALQWREEMRNCV